MPPIVAELRGCPGSMGLNINERRRIQELVFDLARALTRESSAQPQCSVPSHVLFPQLVQIVWRYLKEKVDVRPPADLKDLFLAPYYG